MKKLAYLLLLIMLISGCAVVNENTTLPYNYYIVVNSAKDVCQALKNEYGIWYTETMGVGEDEIIITDNPSRGVFGGDIKLRFEKMADGNAKITLTQTRKIWNSQFRTPKDLLYYIEDASRRLDRLDKAFK